MDSQTGYYKISFNLLKCFLTVLIGTCVLTTSGLAQSTPIRSVASLPATCTGGNAFQMSDMVTLITAGVGNPYICAATNTWIAYGVGGSLPVGVAKGSALVSNGVANPPVYQSKNIIDIRDYGAVCDNSTDDTSAINSALTALYNLGGGTLLSPPGLTCKIIGQITLPNDAVAVPNQKPIRITSASPASMSSTAGGITGPNGAGSWNLTFNSTTAKIDTRGAGYLEIDHIILQDTAADCAAFIFTTSTVLHIHDTEGFGTTGTPCNDFIILGGTGTTVDGSSSSPFQGYGTVIRDNFVNRVRRFVKGQTYANGIIIKDNTIWNAAGFSTGGAIEFTGITTNTDTGNVISGNLIESGQYKYGISFLDYSQSNSVLNNNCFDSTVTTISCVNFALHADYNLVIAGWSADTPTVYMTDADGTNTLINMHQTQYSVFPQGINGSSGQNFLVTQAGNPSGYNIKATGTNDEFYEQIITANSKLQWWMKPLGGTAESMFSMNRVDANQKRLDCLAVTNCFIENTGTGDLKIGTNNAGAVTWLCGGSFNCKNFATAAGVWTSQVSMISPLYSTTTNCASSASPAVCGAAPAGSFTVATGATTKVVNTTAVTANSEILINNDSTLGTTLSVTCNTTLLSAPWQVTARTAGTSFTLTIAVAPVTNPECFSYSIVN